MLIYFIVSLRTLNKVDRHDPKRFTFPFICSIQCLKIFFIRSNTNTWSEVDIPTAFGRQRVSGARTRHASASHDPRRRLHPYLFYRADKRNAEIEQAAGTSLTSQFNEVKEIKSDFRDGRTVVLT